MKFKPGEKIKIKSYQECSKYQMIFSCMEKYCLTVGTIKGYSAAGGSYNISPGGFLWKEECLEKINKQVLKNE